MARKKLPADYAIDALALEADRRRKAGSPQYSYGKLVADTTACQREKISEEYKRKFGRRKADSDGAKALLDDEGDVDPVKEILGKREAEDE